jgi:methanogenic corrinoid protein MtbC1
LNWINLEHQRVIAIVGGQPLTDEFAHQTGGDDHTHDTSRAVILSKSSFE